MEKIGILLQWVATINKGLDNLKTSSYEDREYVNGLRVIPILLQVFKYYNLVRKSHMRNLK